MQAFPVEPEPLPGQPQGPGGCTVASKAVAAKRRRRTLEQDLEPRVPP